MDRENVKVGRTKKKDKQKAKTAKFGKFTSKAVRAKTAKVQVILAKPIVINKTH